MPSKLESSLAMRELRAFSRAASQAYKRIAASSRKATYPALLTLFRQ